jgi:transcriptional regulator with XRE-family HTH domain
VEKDIRKLRYSLMGKFLLEHRVRSGLTQKDLAKKLRYRSAQFVSNWERGLSLPPTKQFHKIAQLLQIEPAHLLGTWEEYQKRMLQLETQNLRKMLRLL